MTAATLDARNRETTRTVGGVRTNPNHWANAVVHSFGEWVDEKTLTTWCDLTITLTEGGVQTHETITCLQCGQASWEAIRAWMAKAVR